MNACTWWNDSNGIIVAMYVELRKWMVECILLRKVIPCTTYDPMPVRRATEIRAT
jgi:hypothetical protein